MHLHVESLIECSESRVRTALLETVRTLVVELHDDGRTRERARGAVAELLGKVGALLRGKGLETDVKELIGDVYKRSRSDQT